MGGEHDERSLGDVLLRLDEDRAALLEVAHDVDVVDDLVADVDRRPVALRAAPRRCRSRARRRRRSCAALRDEHPLATALASGSERGGGARRLASARRAAGPCARCARSEANACATTRQAVPPSGVAAWRARRAAARACRRWRARRPRAVRWRRARRSRCRRRRRLCCAASPSARPDRRRPGRRRTRSPCGRPGRGAARPPRARSPLVDHAPGGRSACPARGRRRAPPPARTRRAGLRGCRSRAPQADSLERAPPCAPRAPPPSSAQASVSARLPSVHARLRTVSLTLRRRERRRRARSRNGCRSARSAGRCPGP